MRWNDPISRNPKSDFKEVTSVPESPYRFYGSKPVPPNGAVTLSVTLNADQVAGLEQLAEEHNFKDLNPLFHLAVREFLRAEGVLWHEGRLRVSIGAYSLGKS
jgi:hypothetical protein